MAKREKSAASAAARPPRLSLQREFKRNWFLYLMTVPGIIFVFIFSYIPMAGLIMAFKDVNLMKGIFASDWVGFKNFQVIFGGESIRGMVVNAVKNTLFLNILFMVTGTIFSIVLAVAFSEVQGKLFKKVTQSISILPYFISWTVISVMLNGFINADNGLFTLLIERATGQSINFYIEAGYWPMIMSLLKIWQGAGYGAIVYIATITGIDPGIYEAAEIDGASKWQQIVKITLPILWPTVILMTIFNIGKIFYGDFGMIYALINDNSALYSTTDVFDTFVYRMMRNMQEYGLSTAAGMVQSICGCLLVIGANALARKYEPDAAIF